MNVLQHISVGGHEERQSLGEDVSALRDLLYVSHVHQIIHIGTGYAL
jgi:hypothetical protein